jgi:hypothetical protein
MCYNALLSILIFKVHKMIEVLQNSTMIVSTTETSATTSKKRGEGRRY